MELATSRLEVIPCYLYISDNVNDNVNENFSQSLGEWNLQAQPAYRTDLELFLILTNKKITCKTLCRLPVLFIVLHVGVTIVVSVYCTNMLWNKTYATENIGLMFQTNKSNNKRRK